MANQLPVQGEILADCSTPSQHSQYLIGDQNPAVVYKKGSEINYQAQVPCPFGMTEEIPSIMILLLFAQTLA